MFSSITYGKGGCILRMLYNCLGEQDWKIVLNRYLETYKYRNATTEQFLTLLTEVGGE